MMNALGRLSASLVVGLVLVSRPYTAKHMWIAECGACAERNSNYHNRYWKDTGTGTACAWQHCDLLLRGWFFHVRNALQCCDLRQGDITTSRCG